MRATQSGFSLIELMIAVTLGLLAVAAVGSVFIYGSRSYKEDDRLSRMQDELRFAMAQIVLDLEMAGFVAQVRDPVNDVTIDASASGALPQEGDCGPTTDGAVSGPGNNWVFQERRAFLAVRAKATAAEAVATFPCIGKDEFQEGTDIIAVKRLGGVTVDDDELQPDRLYLRTNGLQTVIHRGTVSPSPADAPDAGVSIYEYRPIVWYVRRFSVSPDESPLIPALCRKIFVPDRGMVTDEAGCVAQGVENLHLELGFDVTGPGVPPRPDGAPDYFVEYDTADEPGPAQLAQIVAVRVHLLGRSITADIDYSNEKSYRLGSLVIPAPKDRFYRKTQSTLVVLRNAAYRLNPFALPQ